MKLNAKQQFVLDYLKSYPGIWTSPGIIGQMIRVHFKTGSGHSSTGSPICKRLVELKLAERNKKGHYKAL